MAGECLAHVAKQGPVSEKGLPSEKEERPRPAGTQGREGKGGVGRKRQEVTGHALPSQWRFGSLGLTLRGSEKRSKVSPRARLVCPAFGRRLWATCSCQTGYLQSWYGHCRAKRDSCPKTLDSHCAKRHSGSGSGGKVLRNDQSGGRSRAEH